MGQKKGMLPSPSKAPWARMWTGIVSMAERNQSREGLDLIDGRPRVGELE